MAVSATEARKACTGIAVDIVVACSTIEARVAATFVNINRTVLATKAIHAQTGVFSYSI